MEIKSIFKSKNKKQEKRSDALLSAKNTGLTFKNGFAMSYNPLQLSAVYRCVDLIASSIAVMPLYVENLSTGRKEQHPIHRVFRESRLTKYELVKRLISDLLLRGNAYAKVVRDNRGKPIEIVWLNGMQQVTKTATDVIYKTQEGETLESCDVIHLKSVVGDTYTGVSAVSMGSKSFKLGSTLENNAYNFFSNGCALSGILSVASSLTPQQIQDIHKAWDESYANSSGIAVLQGNMTYQSVSHTAKDNELLNSREFFVSDVCRWFGVPVSLLSKGMAVKEDHKSFILYTVLPLLEQLEQELSRKLLMPSEQDRYVVFFDENYLLRVDKDSEANYYTMLVNNGILTRNEARHMLGFSPVEGGDELIIPFTDINQNKLDNNGE